VPPDDLTDDKRVQLLLKTFTLQRFPQMLRARYPDREEIVV
jgi:hypothetical protein